MSKSEYRILVSCDGFDWKHSLVLFFPGSGNVAPSTQDPIFSTLGGVEELREEFEKMGAAFDKEVIELVQPMTSVVFHPKGGK